MGGSILCSFDLYFLFIKCKRVKLSHSHYCLLPVDSSMSLSVTECNWFCQGQSIAPWQASSAGDRGCITVNLYSGYKKWHCVFVHGCFKNRNNDVTEECNGLDTHWPSDQVKLQDPSQLIITWQTCRKCGKLMFWMVQCIQKVFILLVPYFYTMTLWKMLAWNSCRFVENKK